MKKIYMIIIFGLIHLTLINSQYSPYIGIVKVFPSNPTFHDNIYLFTEVGTSNLGYYLGYQIKQHDTLITVESCYFRGFSTQPQLYFDTINLGKRPPGNYTIHFIAYQSNNGDSCERSDTNSVYVKFKVTVESSIGMPYNKAGLKVFPNPVNEGKLLIVSDNRIKRAELTDISGKIICNINKINKQQFEIEMGWFSPGVYFINVYNIRENRITMKILKP